MRCGSCARKQQWKDGAFVNICIDKTATTRKCAYCGIDHPWKFGESNEYWLMRKKDGSKYECRVLRKVRYIKERKDPQKRLRKAVSTLIRDCVNKHGAFKNGSFPKYVEWTVEELKTHLEDQFVDGMSWKNYGKGAGKWSIDHIIPDSYFKYSSMEDDGFKQSWALDNLQPMWDVDNCAKNNKLNWRKA